MYYIIDISTFKVLRGPFLTLESCYKILKSIQEENKQAYLVKTIEIS